MSTLPTINTSQSSLPSNARVSDLVGRSALCSIAGEQHVGFKFDDISVNFHYGISPLDIVNGGSSTGTGSVSSVGSTAQVSSGTGTGMAEIESRASVRYRSGHEMHCAISVVFPTPEAGVNQYAGFLDDVDGWCVGYSGTQYGLWFIEGGNTTFIPQSSFNVDTLDGNGQSGYTINPQAAQLYRLSFAWHGFLPLILEVYHSGFGDWIPVHILEFVNIDTDVHLENPDLPIKVKIERASGSGSDLQIKTGSWRAGVIAGNSGENNSIRWFGAFATERSKSANPNHLVTLRSKALFGGKKNHIKTQVKIIVSINDTNKPIIFKAIRLSALNATDRAVIEADLSDVSTNSSTIESSNLDYTLTSAVSDSDVLDIAVVQTGTTRENLDVDGFDLFADEDVVFVADSATNASGTISFQLNFRELF